MIDFRIVQEGSIEITREDGVKDSRPTCSLLSLNGFNVLIDLEHPKEDGREFQQALQSLGLAPEEIQGVIFTHLHPDHMGHKNLFGNARFLFQANEKLAFYLRNDPIALLSGDALVEMTPQGFARPEEISWMPELHELGDRLFVHAAPGHTTGSQVVFACMENKVHAWAGDYFLRQDYYDRWEPPGSSWDQRMVLEQMKFIAEHADIIVPGHGAPFAPKGEKSLGPHIWNSRFS
jgi:glyoxylase-like metal-dependent hydrolase (beta-lactamase superfamily II)